MKHPDFLTPEIHEAYEDRSHLCTIEAHEFLVHISGSGSRVCQEVSRKKKEIDHLRVFWYPPQTDELDRNSTPTESVVKQRSVEERVTSLLLSLKTPMAASSYMLVQFWAPSGGVLTLSGQPFCITELYDGLCGYRCSWIQAEQDGYSASEDGPLERVFTRGYPEYCKCIDSYYKKEFPMKYRAILCGFSNYLAVPVFDRGQQCLGVLEFLSCGTDLHSVMKSLEDSEFEYAFPHSQECTQVHLYIPMSTLKSVREEHRLPLIQIWVPCICDTTSRFTKLVCEKRSINLTMDYASEDLNMSLLNEIHSVPERKGWVGRAYSEQKACFCRNTSQISISDYPLALLTRSFGLNACCAIPLHFIHPKLTRLVLEVFLPPQQNCDVDIENVLRSLLTTFAQKLAKINVAYGLKENEEFCVKLSHSDDENFVYFDVYRSGVTTTKACVAPPQIGVDTSKIASSKAEVNFDAGQNGQEVEVASGYLDGDQFRTPEMLKQNFVSSDQVPKLSEASDIMSSLHDQTEILRKTFEAINQYCGSRKVINAVERRVTRRTWRKCRCRKFGIGLLSHKRKKALRDEKDKIICDESYSVIVKATYRENDTAKFRLCSNSGIEKLHAELHKRFILEVDKYNVKYLDEDGDWIILCCDDDLRLYMEARKRSSESAMKMIVIPVSYKVIR